MATAVIAVGISFGATERAQAQTTVNALYRLWDSTYTVMERQKKGGSCAGVSEGVYLDAFKYSVAYYFYRIAMRPVPGEKEKVDLDATIRTAEDVAKNCLQILEVASFSGREGQLNTAAEPTALEKFGSSIVSLFGGTPQTGTAPLVERPRRLTPPPSEVTTASALMELDQLRAAMALLQSEKATLAFEKSVLQNEKVSLETRLQQLEPEVKRLSDLEAAFKPVVMDPSGVWNMYVEGANALLGTMMVHAKPGRVRIRIMDSGAAEHESTSKDAGGNWVFSIVDNGTPITVRLDFSALPIGFLIRGRMESAAGSVPFYGLKLGDRRIQPR